MGITANTVNPGMTDTNILTDEAKQLFADAGFPLMPAEPDRRRGAHDRHDRPHRRVLGLPARPRSRAVPLPRRARARGPPGAEGTVPPGVRERQLGDWAQNRGGTG